MHIYFICVVVYRVQDNMLSKEEVGELVEFLATGITVQVEADIGSIINMGALALNQLLESAQEKDITLILDTSKVENARLLEEVEKMSLDAIPKHQRRGVGALTSLKDEAKAMRDATGRLEEENKTLQERYGSVQSEASNLARERTQIQSEVNELKVRLSEAERRAGSREIEAKQDSEIRDQIRRLERALEDALEESTRRVSETAQVPHKLPYKLLCELPY